MCLKSSFVLNEMRRFALYNSNLNITMFSMLQQKSINCQAQVRSPKVKTKGLGLTLKSHGTPPHPTTTTTHNF